ncbi:site-specific integrase [Neobacillus cucumis]|uniref:site-specific integrase n=1 Tax=Neobacillus cucumis TaxID=1740721 RepID=UPI001962E147|nr:site-specific integrase [Neobacillus cucumis]MBM7654572.1 integrase [Neobacillus cucumis]
METLALLHKNEGEIVTVDGMPIKMYVQEHFTVEEWTTIYTAKKHDRLMFNIPFRQLNKFDIVSLLDRKPTNRERVLRTYLTRLAYFQRFRLPLEYTINMRNRREVQLENLNIFIMFSDMFDKHYLKLHPENENDEKIVNEDKMAVEDLVERLWMSGYGLIDGIGHEPITEEVLNQVVSISKNITSPARRLKTITLLSYLLSKEEKSPVNNPIFFTSNEVKNVFELEMENWSNDSPGLKSELALAIKDYVFGQMKDRVNEGQLQTYNNENGKSETIEHKKLSSSTWYGRSMHLRILCEEYFYPNEVLTIQDVLQGRIMDAFVDVKDDYQKTSFSSYVMAINSWFDFYAAENSLKVNKKHVMPTGRLGTSDKRYGKYIDFKQAVRLIETLLDDQSPYHEDNKLMEFRQRRAALLALETAKRAHEVSLLKQNALKSNKYGEYFLHFHKTKTGKEHTVKISKEAYKWVEQLLHVAPRDPIEINSEFYLGGDDLKVKRLLAAADNHIPFRGESITEYLRRLQIKIWGENPPGGRYFTAHDLRRMCATYLRMKGYSQEEIAEKLGHDNLDSQFTYTLTAGHDILNSLEGIAKEGVYGIKAIIEDIPNNTEEEEVKTLTEDTFLGMASLVVDVAEDVETAKSFIEKLSTELKEIELLSDLFQQPEGEIPQGFPMRTHNCNAQAQVTCFHHTLKCYKCDKYSPEQNMIFEHKAELVRWIVFAHHNGTILKKTKNKREKLVLPAKIDGIEKDLEDTFKTLFQKFNFSDEECKAIEKEVYLKAKQYISKYYKKIPSPSVAQITEFLKSGVISG